MDFFYLASHDYISSPHPRKCKLVRTICSVNQEKYFLVAITPLLPKGTISNQNSISSLLLRFCKADSKLSEIGKKIIMVDLYSINQILTGEIDEADLNRVGVGTLHLSYEEALKFSPINNKGVKIK